MLGVETPTEVAHNLRREALRKYNPEEIFTGDHAIFSDDMLEGKNVKYLDSEIIAIYW